MVDVFITNIAEARSNDFQKPEKTLELPSSMGL